MTEDELMRAYGLVPERSRIHSGGSASRAALRLLIERDGPYPRCVCGGVVDTGGGAGLGLMAPSVGHVIPVSRGGGDHLGNLRIEHLGCNIRRGNRVDSPIATIARVIERS